MTEDELRHALEFQDKAARLSRFVLHLDHDSAPRHRRVGGTTPWVDVSRGGNGDGHRDVAACLRVRPVKHEREKRGRGKAERA